MRLGDLYREPGDEVEDVESKGPSLWGPWGSMCTVARVRS